MNYRDAQDRYERDPAFKMLVDMMINQIGELNFSPGEIREAAVYAEISFQMMQPPKSITVRREELPSKFPERL